MQIQVYIYKRHDVDLLALADGGYPLSLMMKNALVSYANGQPLFYYIDEILPFDLNDKKSIRLTFRIGKKDVKTTYMLNNIKHSKRGLFCKMVLRNAIIQQNISGFFADENLVNLHYDNLRQFNIGNFPNVIPISSLDRNTSFTFLDKVVEKEQRTFNTPSPFMGMPGNGYGFQPMPLNYQGMYYGAPTLNNPQILTPREANKPINENRQNMAVTEQPVQNRADNEVAAVINRDTNPVPEVKNEPITENSNPLSGSGVTEGTELKMAYDNELFDIFDTL